MKAILEYLAQLADLKDLIKDADFIKIMKEIEDGKK